MAKIWARLALGGIILAAVGVCIHLSPIRVLAQDTPTSTPTRFIPTIRVSLPPVLSPTATASRTFQPSPTVTPSRTLTPSPSLTPSHTQTPTATLTASPTATATSTDTATPSVTPSITFTPSATLTGTQTATATSTASATATSTASETATATNTPTDTPTPSLTHTPTATDTPTITLTPSQTYTPSMTPTRPPPIIERSRPNETNRTSPLSPLLLVGGILLTLVVGGYMVIYARNAAALDRYASGFVVRRCPVCQLGVLNVEERVDRILGIPRVKRTVRCDTCRSVLREVGKRRWRYAIDRVASSRLYELLNNQIIREQQLTELAPDSRSETPYYIDEGR